MKLCTRTWGDGDRLALLIHGGTSDSRTWATVAPELAARGYRVVAPDLRGHGRSPRGRYDDPEAYVGDLIDTLPTDADLAIGHSLGGLFLSLAADRLRPHNLILSEPGFDQDIKPLDFFDTVRALLPSLTAESLQSAHPRWTEQAVALALDAAACLDLDLLEGLKAFRGIDFRPVRAPGHALLQIAGVDSTVKPTTAAELARRGFQVDLIADAGHDIHHDNMPGFLDSLDAFA